MNLGNNPAEELLCLAKEKNLEITDEAFAKYLDDNDEIGHLRKQFYIPRVSELLEESNEVDGPAKGKLTQCYRAYYTEYWFNKGWIQAKNVFILRASR